MDIYGFSTDNLYRAIRIKAERNNESFPDILEQLHKEMANNDHRVSE